MVSLCLTVKNENIPGILKQLAKQSELPDEIVLVDAGEMKHGDYKNKKLNYIYQKCNRSEGRNLAAQKAQYENLVFLDGGCSPKPNWLAEIKSSISRHNVQVVAGEYVSPTNSFFEYLEDKFLNVVDNYPSARNFAIKKKLFEKLDGFSEKLNTAEDLEFFTRLVNRGYKIEKNARAVVIWKLPGRSQYLAKIFNYAAGDAKSGVWWDPRKKWRTHNVRHLINTLKFAVFLFLLLKQLYLFFVVFFMVYVLATAAKNRINFWEFAGNNYLRRLRNVVEFVMIKTLTDIFSVFGFIFGLLLRI